MASSCDLRASNDARNDRDLIFSGIRHLRFYCYQSDLALAQLLRHCPRHVSAVHLTRLGAWAEGGEARGKGGGEEGGNEREVEKGLEGICKHIK